MKPFLWIFTFWLCTLSGVSQVFSNDEWKTYKGTKQESKPTISDYVSADGFAANRQIANDYLIVDSRISNLVVRFREENLEDPTTDGYRVQIFFGKRETALEIKTAFLKSYENIPAYISYQAPNFKVRVGNFRTQLEAEKFRESIKKDFHSAYIVPARINVNDKIDVIKKENNAEDK